MHGGHGARFGTYAWGTNRAYTSAYHALLGSATLEGSWTEQIRHARYADVVMSNAGVGLCVVSGQFRRAGMGVRSVVYTWGGPRERGGCVLICSRVTLFVLLVFISVQILLLQCLSVCLLEVVTIADHSNNVATSPDHTTVSKSTAGGQLEITTIIQPPHRDNRQLANRPTLETNQAGRKPSSNATQSPARL
jgi:hypothetical protein